MFPTFGLNSNLKYTVLLLGQALKPAPKYIIFPNLFGDLPGKGRFPDLGRIKDKFLLLNLFMKIKSQFPLIYYLNLVTYPGMRFLLFWFTTAHNNYKTKCC